MTNRVHGLVWPWLVLVMLSSVGFALTPIFARLLGLDGTEPTRIVFYRYVLTAILLTPFLLISWRNFHLVLMGVVIGAGMGLGYIGYIVVLERTTVATAGVLYLSYPIFTLLFAWALLGVRPGLRGTTGVGLILGAGFVTATPDTLSKLTPEMLLLGLAAPASFGLGITVLTGWLYRLPPIQRLACVPFGATLGLLPLVLRDQSPSDLVPAADVLPQVLGLALATALIPQFLYVIAAPRIGSVSTAIAGAIELPAMIGLAFLIFAERPGQNELIACAMVVSAILMISISRQPKRKPPAI